MNYPVQGNMNAGVPMQGMPMQTIQGGAPMQYNNTVPMQPTAVPQEYPHKKKHHGVAGILAGGAVGVAVASVMPGALLEVGAGVLAGHKAGKKVNNRIERHDLKKHQQG